MTEGRGRSPLTNSLRHVEQTTRRFRNAICLFGICTETTRTSHTRPDALKSGELTAPHVAIRQRSFGMSARDRSICAPKVNLRSRLSSKRVQDEGNNCAALAVLNLALRRGFKGGMIPKAFDSRNMNAPSGRSRRGLASDLTDD